MNNRFFLPALHFHFLTPFYDFLMRLFFRKTYLTISQHIDLKEKQNLLDIGCGSGIMLELLYKKFPRNQFVGLDIDPRILKIARKRLLKNVELIESSCTQLPFPDNSFDFALNTLVIHHLSHDDKFVMIREAYRVLKPNGTLLLFDFSKPKKLKNKIWAFLFRKFEDLDDALAGNYEKWLEQAGFKSIEKVYDRDIMALYKAYK